MLQQGRGAVRRETVQVPVRAQDLLDGGLPVITYSTFTAVFFSGHQLVAHFMRRADQGQRKWRSMLLVQVIPPAAEHARLALALFDPSTRPSTGCSSTWASIASRG